jgi:hypothetical protein
MIVPISTSRLPGYRDSRGLANVFVTATYTQAQCRTATGSRYPVGRRA